MSHIMLKIEHFDPSMHSILGNYTCPLCFNIYFDPVQDEQGHIFCRKCIIDHLKDSQSCPISSDHVIEGGNIQSIEFMNNFVNGLSVSCPGKTKGCNFVGKVKSLSAHLSTCEYDSKADTVKLEKVNIIEDLPKDSSTETDHKEDKRHCSFSELGCKETFIKADEASHFTKFPYQHLYLLFAKFNAEFGKLEDRINKLTSKGTAPQDENQTLLEKKQKKDRNDDRKNANKTLDQYKRFASKGLRIEGNTMTVTNESTTGKHFFFIFNEPVKQSFVMKFEIANFRQWIGVGLCDVAILEENDYNFKVKSLEHGISCFGLNGFKFNQFGENKERLADFPEVNNGEIIKLNFDQQEKTLKLEINGQNWKIKKIDIDRKLYPCVLMLGAEESVKLLGYKSI